MVDEGWPEQDREWIARYRRGTAGRHVPPDVLDARERELLVALRETGTPAAELLGDPDALAADDVAELATTDEAVRAAEGGGARPVLREVGSWLVGLAVVATAALVVRQGLVVDVRLVSVLLAGSVVTALAGWRVARACFAAGRSGAAVGVLTAAGALALLGLGAASGAGADRVVVWQAPVLLVGLVLLVPGVAVRLVARRMPDPRLRTDWDDAEWLRRFRTGLQARLVPSAAVRDHVAEVQQVIHAAGATGGAFAELGHPLVLARQVAAADRTARARRWWVATLVGSGVPVAVAAVVLLLGTWRGLTVPLTVFLLAGAVLALVTGWGGRPWAQRP